MEETKAPALWTNHCEGVDGKDGKLREMISKCVATQWNKWRQKRVRMDHRMTPNVYHGLSTGEQGEKQKVKIFPRCFENGAF
jgi:hypothetical protein